MPNWRASSAWGTPAVCVLPDTAVLAVASGKSPDDFYLFLHRSSELTVSEYLSSLAGTPDFGSSASLFQRAGLLEDLVDKDAVTVFLPFSEVIEGLPEGVIPSDSVQLRDLLSNHVVPANLPPYDLVGNETLQTLNGNMLTLEFSGTESSFWEIEGAPIWWDVPLANGVVYSIDGVTVLAH
jgi:uncharacterized surface protein with fasciclin (FAS1) repeats